VWQGEFSITDMANSEINKRTMGKFILIFLLSFCFILFLSCSDKKNSQGCNPFCEGDQWYVKEFYADPYPSMIPFEENEFLSALEKEIIFWKRDGETLALVGNDKKEVTFGYKGGTDTLTISLALAGVLHQQADKFDNCSMPI
jgi:hypothetical protein